MWEPGLTSGSEQINLGIVIFVRVMRITAVILILGLFSIGMNRFMDIMDLYPENQEKSSLMSCCHSGDHTEDHQEEAHEQSSCCGSDQEEDRDHHCGSSCDCTCCFHLVAISYQMTELPGISVLKHRYGIYYNAYDFEFNTHLLHPPRHG